MVDIEHDFGVFRLSLRQDVQTYSQNNQHREPKKTLSKKKSLVLKVPVFNFRPMVVNWWFGFLVVWDSNRVTLQVTNSFHLRGSNRNPNHQLKPPFYQLKPPMYQLKPPIDHYIVDFSVWMENCNNKKQIRPVDHPPGLSRVAVAPVPKCLPLPLASMAVPARRAIHLIHLRST